MIISDISCYIFIQMIHDVIEAGIYAHYPDAEISEAEDYTKNIPDVYPNETHEVWGSEVTLKKDPIFPIRTYIDFEDKMTQEIKDPLGQILEQMAKMKQGENLWFQITMIPADNVWKDRGVEFINKIYNVEAKAKPPGIFDAVIKAILLLPQIVLEQIGIDLFAMLFGKTAEEEKNPFKALKIPPPADKAGQIAIQNTPGQFHA